MKNVADLFFTSGFGMLAAALVVVLATGCRSEKTTVTWTTRQFIEPTKPFPPTLVRIAVYPQLDTLPDISQGTGERVFDRSTRAAEVFESYLHEIRNKEDVHIQIVDRATLDTQRLEKEIADSELVQPGDATHEYPKMSNVDMILVTKCSVVQKVSEVEKPSVDVDGLIGIVTGRSRNPIRKRRGYQRQVRVNGMFRLTWQGSSDEVQSRSFNKESTDDATPDLFSGRNMSSADLKALDASVDPLLRSMAKEFFQPMVGGVRKTSWSVTVKASQNEPCIQGVRQLRGELWEEALGSFKQAIQEDSEDHRALFGAGVASEKLHRYEDALSYYRRAVIVHQDHHNYYRNGMNRMKLELKRDQ